MPLLRRPITGINPIDPELKEAARRRRQPSPPPRRGTNPPSPTSSPGDIGLGGPTPPAPSRDRSRSGGGGSVAEALALLRGSGIGGALANVASNSQAPRPTSNIPPGSFNFLSPEILGQLGDSGLDVDTSQLDALRAEQLQLALEAISTQYGLEQAQVEAQLAGLDPELNTLLALADAQRRQDLRAAERNAARRGIERSGLFAEDVAEVEQASANERAAATAQTEATRTQLQNQLAAVEQARQIAEGQAQAQSTLDELDTAILLALARNGIAL